MNTTLKGQADTLLDQRRVELVEKALRGALAAARNL